MQHSYIEFWQSRKLTGRSLWCEFSNEFDDWIDEDWDKVPKRTIKYFRTYLLANGVFVEVDGNRIARNIERTARSLFHPRTADEINGLMAQSEGFRRNIEDPDFAKDI